MNQNHEDDATTAQELAGVFSALAHPTRIRIIEFLQDFKEEGERAGLIQKALDIPASTLSHHLASLQKVGIVSSLRQERFIYYKLSKPKLKEIGLFFTR